MKKITKKLFTILLVLFVASKLFAVDGVITYVKGKVEVKRNNSWVSLKVGDKVSQSEVLNTGFQSEAKVKLMNNVLYLGPVTRVTLSTLATDDEKDKVNVFLSTGTVRSKVNRTDTKRVSYTIRTPIAVASVRGTDVFVTSGNKFGLLEGKVSINFTEAETRKAKKALKKKLEEEAASREELEKSLEEKLEEAKESGNTEEIADIEDSLKNLKENNVKSLDEAFAEIDNLNDSELLAGFENDPELGKSGTLLTPGTGADLSGNTPIAGPTSSTTSKADEILNAASTASKKEAVKNEVPVISKPEAAAKPTQNLAPTTGGVNVGLQLDTGSLNVEVGFKN